ncbi:hypothetical protein [Flavitalea sp.]|nr:hypothetical protein [Flavitalea sp.]
MALTPADGPTGLAIDRKSHRLFAGCDKLLIVLDAIPGKVIQQVPIGDGCDDVAYICILYNKLILQLNPSCVA